MRLLLLISAFAILSGCGSTRNTVPNGQEESGWAVHYGEKDQGKSTASGEPYNHGAHTASHRFYPFGSRVKVTNLNNGRHTQVRINDRPGTGDGTDLVIGLSGAAAADLWMLGPGRVPVRIEVLMLTENPAETQAAPDERLAVYQPPPAPVYDATYPASAAVATATKSGSAPAFSQEGIATYYNDNMQGRPTASGEPFDQNAYTASHATIPLGTEIRVINLDDNRDVWVIVNDRMPQLPERIISLSRAAASEIGVVQAGKLPVRIEYGDEGFVENGYVTPAGGLAPGSALVNEIWTVQVAALASRAVANDNVRELGDEAWLEEIDVNGKTMYRLFFREVFSREEALSVQAELARKGYSGTFIRRIE